MQRVKGFLYASAELKKTVADTLSGDILEAANRIKSRLEKGGKLILMGNGGSAADSQHIAAELVGRFKKRASGHTRNCSYRRYFFVNCSGQ
jgi:D-sedoheptulose 7-phosphate isomerase